jgi:hypothetical protein
MEAFMKTAAVSCVLCVVALSLAAQPLPSDRQVIPAVARVEGADGASWRTDVVLHNPGSGAANVTLSLLVEAEDGLPGTPVTVDLPDALAAGATVLLGDVVGTFFPDHAAGALIISARTDQGQPVEIIADSRTWTPGEDGVGSYGQGIAAVPWRHDRSLSGTERRLTDLETGESFRTNIGFANLSETTAATIAVDILDAAGEPAGTRWVTLEPSSWKQLNDLLGKMGLGGSGFAAIVRLADWQDLTPGVPDATILPPDMIAYASKVDRHTNDPTFLESRTQTSQWALARHRVVPVVAHVEGANNSSWRTDLTAHYASDVLPAFLQYRLIPSADGPADEPREQIAVIGPGQTVSIADVVGEKFPDHQSGGLVAWAWNGGASFQDVLLSSRTWTPAAEGPGTYGQGIPGAPRFYGTHTVRIVGLENSPTKRTNLGLVNPSTNNREHFTIEILDAEGMSRGTIERTLEPWTQDQINGVLAELDLEGGPYTAVVELRQSENLKLESSDPWTPIFFAYGSIVDNRTNDPTFIAGVDMTESDDQPGEWFDFTADAPWYRCPDEPWPSEATVVSTFNGAHHYFGAENRRSITEQVTFPATADWNQVGLRIHLECPPTGPCDDWDRWGSLQLVLNPEADEAEWEYLELARYITPYKIEMCEYIDITDLAPLLTGEQTLVSMIDTWVGPGHSAGDGWSITYEFVFYPGEDRTPMAVENIWGRREIVVGQTGEGATVDDQIDPVAVEIPADAGRVEARLITTGHSFGNTDNCAEFCPMRQDLIIDGAMTSVLPWRTDCEYNPHSPQFGTWQYDRNGWCPGAVSVGQIINITDMITPGGTATIDFDIRVEDGAEYVNTSPVDWLPNELVSLQLLIYRE